MNGISRFLTTHWLAALLLAAAIVLGLLLLVRRRRGAAPSLRVLAGGLALAGLGGLVPSAAWQLGLAATALTLLLVLLLVLLLTSWWSERVGYGIAAVLAFGAGGYLAAVLGAWLA